MKEYEVIISGHAEKDLRDIYEYIAFELLSPDNAARLLSRLESSIKKLDVFPEAHRRYDEEPWHSRNLRVLPVDNYVVFYILDNDEMTVTVIRVIYGGRNLATQLDLFTGQESD